jgi:hypothetical protein
MESLDFVYDLIDGMEKQNVDYFVLAIRKGQDEDKADIFYNLKNEQSIKIFETVIGNVDVRNPEQGDDDDW